LFLSQNLIRFIALIRMIVSCSHALLLDERDFKNCPVTWNTKNVKQFRPSQVD